MAPHARAGLAGSLPTSRGTRRRALCWRLAGRRRPSRWVRDNAARIRASLTCCCGSLDGSRAVPERCRGTSCAGLRLSMTMRSATARRCCRCFLSSPVASPSTAMSGLRRSGRRGGLLLLAARGSAERSSVASVPELVDGAVYHLTLNRHEPARPGRGACVLCTPARRPRGARQRLGRPPRRAVPVARTRRAAPRSRPARCRSPSLPRSNTASQSRATR